ncbi:MAG: methyltransferase [Bacteroidetes bacterium]|nr:methyltransferase [Bacteroidota bacterium]
MKKEITTPPELMSIVQGFRNSRIILTAFELGVFTVTSDGSITSDEIAQQIQTNPRATNRLLNALVAIGLLQKSGDKFHNTSFSSKFLIKGRPDYMTSLAHSVSLWKTWSTLTDCIRSGNSVTQGVQIEERSSEWLEGFIAAMHNRAPQQAIEIAPLLDLSKTKRLLDVGGGSGAFAFEFIRRNPSMQVVVFDLPSVVTITQRYINREGFSNSVTTLPGDYLKDPFGDSYDLILLSAVVHINSFVENENLVRKCGDALNSGGQLVILDHIMSPDRTEPEAGAVFALNMLVGTKQGDTYTEAEISKWMKDAGLTSIERKDTVQGTSILTGIRK